MNWYSPPIYDDYVDDYIITNDNNANDIIDDVLVDEIEVKCKVNIKDAKKIIDFDCWSFDYKVIVIVIINVDVFIGYMNTTHIDGISLRFAIHYYRSRWKINNM